jgi:hypothetical protein
MLVMFTTLTIWYPPTSLETPLIRSLLWGLLCFGSTSSLICAGNCKTAVDSLWEGDLFWEKEAMYCTSFGKSRSVEAYLIYFVPVRKSNKKNFQATASCLPCVGAVSTPRPPYTPTAISIIYYFPIGTGFKPCGIWVMSQKETSRRLTASSRRRESPTFFHWQEEKRKYLPVSCTP